MRSTELTQNTSPQPIFISINWTKDKHHLRTGAITQKTLFVFEHRRLYTVRGKNKTRCFKVTVKTQQQCINTRILLWQRVSVL